MKTKIASIQNKPTEQSYTEPSLEGIVFDSMNLGEKASKLMAEKIRKAGMDDIARGFFVENTVHPSQHKYVQILRIRLVKEYKVQTVSEGMLLDLAISAYFRGLQCSMLYNHHILEADGKTTSYTQLKLNAIKELGKQVEQANRQFLSTLATLREMKRPPVNIKIHSNQAFVAENQQFNKNA
ncbi:MAG: hypothetical protein ACREGI_05790 [Candidatus Levyibacteriota bacterium]